MICIFLHFQITCPERVYKQLKCGHYSQLVACTEDTDSIVCHKIVEIPCPECTHISNPPCSITQNETTVRSFQFNALILKTQLCGHKHLPSAEGADESVPCMTVVT